MSCNHMIGEAHDNPETLRAGADYLESTAEQVTLGEGKEQAREQGG
jgi:hypothetical protein